MGEASIGRIRAALNALPTERQPQLDDPVGQWLPARVANPLARAGLATLADLNQAAIRPGWHRAVPGLGRTGRERAEGLLARLRGARQLAAPERPVNRLLRAWHALEAGEAPAVLDGRQGRFRVPAAQCALEADRDPAAIETWIRAQPNPITRAAYRKKLARVLLWATTVRGRAFSDLTVEDAAEYRQFLRDPQPTRDWVGPRRPVGDPDWRPFAGPLNPASQRYALQVIRTGARWLREQNYLLVNPWASMRAVAGSPEPLALERVPTQHHWVLIRDLADALEGQGWEAGAAQRCRFVLDFLRGTGLRVSELAALRLADLYEGEPGEWSARVQGKGGKVAVIDLLPLAKRALETYLRERWLPSLIEANDPHLPVVSMLARVDVGLSRKALWAILARFRARFRALGIAELTPVNPRLGEQLRRLSPHALRHVFGSHALANGASLKDVQEALRHSNIRTTSLYVHADQRQRRRRLAVTFG